MTKSYYRRTARISPLTGWIVYTYDPMDGTVVPFRPRRRPWPRYGEPVEHTCGKPWGPDCVCGHVVWTQPRCALWLAHLAAARNQYPVLAKVLGWGRTLQVGRLAFTERVEIIDAACTMPRAWVVSGRGMSEAVADASQVSAAIAQKYDLPAFVHVCRRTEQGAWGLPPWRWPAGLKQAFCLL